MTTSNVFHSADLHVNHANILKYMEDERPFDSLEEMAETLIDNFNTVMKKDDTLIIHGDLAMGIIKDSVPIAGRLPGKKVLIPGNHDRCWMHFPQKKKIAEMRKFYRDCGFVIVDAPFNLRRVSGVNLTMNHFPWQEFCTDGRELERHPKQSDYPGWWNLHGHVHGDWKVRAEDRMINVGVDVWDLKPVPQEQLIEIIKNVS